VLDVSVLFAMIVYGIVALALRALIDWLTYRVELLRQREAHSATLAQQTATVAQAAQYQPVPPAN